MSSQSGIATGQGVQLPPSELALLCAEDNELYARTFFPRTVRQASPAFHSVCWDTLDNPNARYCCFWIFRDGAKTSLLRLFASKRIAYAVSHTILYIGKSEGLAVRSTRWLRRQVEFNTRWAQFYRLRAGAKWQDHEFEIINGVDEQPIWVMAAGIEGSIRGLNQDDFRPDLIILDDVLDEENSATPEMRKKLNDRIHGAVKPSLAPRSESPNATLAMLQTPIHLEDASSLAQSDPEFTFIRVSCWTPDTENLPLNSQVSSWPERYPSEERRAQKRAALAANRGAVWYREAECKITSPETADFRAAWLNYWTILPERHEMDIVVGVDPVPPPSEVQISKGMHNKDYECFAVWGRHKDNYYLLEYALNRGHNPDWTVMQAFILYARWRPRKFIVEGTAYQRTLKWILQQAMTERRTWFMIDTKDGEGFFNRRKRERIVDAFQMNGARGAIYIGEDHVDFVNQWSSYPDVSNDDLLDASASAVSDLSEEFILEGEAEHIEEDEPLNHLEFMHCP